MNPIVIPTHNPDAPEAVIQKLVFTYVNKIPGVIVWRMNTGGARTPTGFVHYGEPGQADLAGLIAPSGRRLEIELKTKRGRLRESQREYGARISHYGGLYIVARTLTEAMVPICEFLGLPYEIKEVFTGEAA